jgi:hypothetical protein
MRSLVLTRPDAAHDPPLSNATRAAAHPDDRGVTRVVE